MQASALTFTAAKSYAKASIRLACAMALDLSTLSTIDKFDFQTYNETLAENSGLALGSVRNTMTAAKKLVTKYPAFYTDLSKNYGLSDMALTRAMQHASDILKQGNYGSGLPELLAALDGKTSPMLQAQAARAEAAKAANEALALAALQAKQGPDLTIQQQAEEQATLADEENTVLALVQTATETTPNGASGTGSQIVNETENETAGFEWVHVGGLSNIRCDIHDNATPDELYALAETLMQMAQAKEVDAQQAMAA